jgi:hypothetical protein
MNSMIRNYASASLKTLTRKQTHTRSLLTDPTQFVYAIPLLLRQHAALYSSRILRPLQPRGLVVWLYNKKGIEIR